MAEIAGIILSAVCCRIAIHRTVTAPGPPSGRERLKDAVLTTALLGTGFALFVASLIRGLPKWAA